MEKCGEVDPVGDEIGRDDHADLGVAGDVGELLGAIARVDQNRHRSEQRGAEE